MMTHGQLQRWRKAQRWGPVDGSRRACNSVTEQSEQWEAREEEMGLALTYSGGGWRRWAARRNRGRRETAAVGGRAVAVRARARSAFDRWLNGPWAISNGARFGAVGLPRVSGRPVYPFPISPDIFQINTIAPTLKLQNTTSPKFKNLQTWRGGKSIQMEQVSFLD
jgi:hypothetical protein